MIGEENIDDDNDDDYKINGLLYRFGKILLSYRPYKS